MSNSYLRLIEMLPDEMVLVCTCGRQVTLSNHGSTYPEEYVGRCECGLRWQLVNLNAIFDEEDEEGEEEEEAI